MPLPSSSWPLPAIRTITLGIEEAHPLTATSIQRAAHFLGSAAARYREAGYEVQTLRLATRPLLEDLADRPGSALQNYARALQTMLTEVGLSFCSLGPAPAVQPHFPPERIELLADLLLAGEALNAGALLADSEHGLRQEAALPIARVILRLAQESAEGFANFRFAMLACVPPGCPFFPAAYHRGPAAFALGLQSAPLLAAALQEAADREGRPLPPERIGAIVRQVLEEQLTPLVALAQELSAAFGLRFGGIDLSPAPLGEASIVAALEACGYGQLGDYGTLTAAAAITHGLQNSHLPACGYSGLMLPVLEDALLGQRWEQGRLHTHQLLLYSAVCGTGLDTIPLPGATAEDTIAHLLLDVASLAVRLRKPLSARLFPVPGRAIGERTAFSSPYLSNTLIR
jgi:uncharacterized protein (UPF0210 family)